VSTLHQTLIEAQAPPLHPFGEGVSGSARLRAQGTRVLETHRYPHAATFARQRGASDIAKFTLTLRKGADGRWLIMSGMDNGNF